mgnify:CR=1 FL=1
MNNIDLTNCKTNKFKAYLGSNGTKRCIIYEDKEYMVKYPPVPTRNKEMSYANSCISEYIGCHIFELAEIPVQETFLATITDNNKTKIVVACKDMETCGIKLIPFAGLKNTIVNSPTNGYGTELSEILETFETQKIFEENTIKNRFWETFIVDALIANFDRHNGNWGYLYNEIEKKAELAPIYDCGSCLYPQMDKELMQKVLNSPEEIKNRIFIYPTSAIKENNKKINYKEYIEKANNPDCNNALLKIYPKLKQEKINEIIDNTPYITDLQKTFYKKIINERRKIILEPTFKQLLEKKQNETITFKKEQSTNNKKDKNKKLKKI